MKEEENEKVEPEEDGEHLVSRCRDKMMTGGKGAECEEEASSSSRLDTKSVIKNNANPASPRLLQTGRRGTRASRYLDVAHGAAESTLPLPPTPPSFTFLVHSDQRAAIQPD